LSTCVDLFVLSCEHIFSTSNCIVQRGAWGKGIISVVVILMQQLSLTRILSLREMGEYKSSLFLFLSQDQVPEGMPMSATLGGQEEPPGFNLSTIFANYMIA